ncbi:methyltransferase-like protein 25B [Xiphophorus couchianus]|uniref:methyltransferase-like protein 25B n=1 Tax=Xiphophorus couchianus TaxID=32473 RepID=UPI001016058E|nr:protein RRNAD1 [Xiphophorus couchianus]
MSEQLSVSAAQDAEFRASFTAQQQRDLARRLTTFLSQYSHLTDSFIIEFFTENLWQTLPSTWQAVLQDISYPQTAELLLDDSQEDRRYPSVWPLSLLAFRATAHALAFPRECRPDRGKVAASVKPDEFLENQSQSSLLGHIFRKHVKPKKQHEIRKLGMLVKQLCDHTGCRRVVDVGSGQGHLTRFLSFGLGLSVTAIEADHTLAAMASRYDGELLSALEKEKRKKSCSFQLPEAHSIPRHMAGWVNPRASWEGFIKQLKDAHHVIEVSQASSAPMKKRRSDLSQTSHPEGPSYDSNIGGEQMFFEGSCCSDIQAASEAGLNPEKSRKQDYPDFVLTGLHACGDLSATLLRHFVCCPQVRGITSVACCYMKITTKENPTPPGLISPPTPPTPSTESFHFEFGYPMSCWVKGLPGHQLSYKAREGACHAVEDYVRRLGEESEQLRTHCYRAILETFIRDMRPDLRRAGIQTIKKAHLLPFTEYARLGLPRVGLPADLPLDQERVEAMLKQQNKVVVYFTLSLLLAPVVETLVLLDRMIYLEENGVDSQLIPLFNPNFSPRNFVLVAVKPSR